MNYGLGAGKRGLPPRGLGEADGDSWTGGKGIPPRGLGRGDSFPGTGVTPKPLDGGSPSSLTLMGGAAFLKDRECNGMGGIGWNGMNVLR